MLTRIQLLLLIVYKLVILCWHPALAEFTNETCLQLNATANITCTEEDSHSAIVFSNEDHLKIYVSKDYASVTISCFSTAEGLLEISADLPKVQLGRLNDVTIDGCIPFDDIFQRLGITTGTKMALLRGVTSTPLKRGHLANLTGITDFVLSGFSQLDADVLADMEGIENIHLTRLNGSLPEGLLAPISAHLSQLHMRDYGMKMPPAGLFAPLYRLETLDLSYNELNTISSGTFAQLYNLTELDLSNNLLTHLPADVFRSLRKLVRLYLSNNRLKQFELGTFATLSNLQHLEMENNALELTAATACSIFDGLTSLEYLEMSNNSLSVYCLPHDMSSVRVKASDNKISALLVQPGQNQPRQLVNFNVRNNRLEHLSAEVLQYLHDSLEELSLAHNPWQCDCEAMLWLNFIRLNNKLVIDLKELRCADGRAVEQVIQLASSDVCKQVQQWYYIFAIVALAVLAVTALTAAWTYRRTARRNAGKRECLEESELS